jgi:hypothetical protein
MTKLLQQRVPLDVREYRSRSMDSIGCPSVVRPMGFGLEFSEGLGVLPEQGGFPGGQ